MSDIQYHKKTPKIKTILTILILCLISALLNTVLSSFISGIIRFPLYLDTVFTVAVCFAAGLVPGILTGLFSISFSPLVTPYLLGVPAFLTLGGFLFFPCVLAEIFLVYVFHKKIRSREGVFLEMPSLHNFIGIAAQLLMLAALACMAISILGGLIDYIMTQLPLLRPNYPEDTFKLGLLVNNVPLLAAAILSRIPINIVDRFVVVFGGFGVSLLFRKCLANKEQ